MVAMLGVGVISALGVGVIVRFGDDLGVIDSAGRGRGVSDGVDETVTEGSGVGVTRGSGDAGVGEEVGAAFFFIDVDVFFLRLGVGDGFAVKKSLNFLPSDSSSSAARASTSQDAPIAITSMSRSSVFMFRQIRPPTPAAQLYSFGCRPRSSRAGNFRSGSARGNLAAPNQVEAFQRRGYFETLIQSECSRLRG